MRVPIGNSGASELRYEIRSIVVFAQKLEKLGVPITWENIGDPIAKGEQVPEWIRDIISKEVKDNNNSFGYSPTKGLDSAREYLAQTRSRETENPITPENIIFFNGLGDAIHEVYTWLNPYARVLGPSPAYPTHSSIEGAHAKSRHLTYNLDPKNDWMPDIKDIRDKVYFDQDVAGILIINPDNPTGAVYPKRVLEQIVDIAKEYNLFLVADEVYANLTYDGNFVSLAEVAGEVPTMIMRGLSKEVPWPGSRCGWVEFYNTDRDQDYAGYIQSIENAKMNEVCSTTLPQSVLPSILSDSRYKGHVKQRADLYRKKAKIAAQILNKSSSLQVVEPKGAFYLAVTFSESFLLSPPKLKPISVEAKKLLDAELAKDPDMKQDKRFCLELLAATGICTVPLSSGFNSHIQGFRMTLLETNDTKFEETLNAIIVQTQ